MHASEACLHNSQLRNFNMLPTLSCRVYWSMLGSGPQRTGMSRARRAIGSRTLHGRVAQAGGWDAAGAQV